MTLKDFLKQQAPENSKGGQCAAFAEKFYKFGPVGNPYISKLTYFKKYGSTNITDILVGDVVLTDDSKVYGHIFIVNSDLGDKWGCTESNFNLDERVHHTRMVSKTSPRLKAHLRPEPKFMLPIITKVSLYRFLVPNPAIIEAGLQLFDQQVKEATNDEFKVITQVADTSAIFHSKLTTNGIMVDSNEILELPSNSKVVCLIHDPTKIIGPLPTNPFHEAIIKNGVTPIQVPTTWFAEFPEVFSQYYLHELLHAWYYLIGNLPYDEQVAKVHNPGPNWGGFGTPTKYYLSLLIELKPHWSKLTQTEMVNQTKIVLGKDGTTVYKAIPVAEDFANFIKQAGVEGIEIPNPIPPASSL